MVVEVLSTRELSEPQLSKIVKEFQDDAYVEISETWKPYAEVQMTISDYFDLLNGLIPLIGRDQSYDDPYNLEKLD